MRLSNRRLLARRLSTWRLPRPSSRLLRHRRRHQIWRGRLLLQHRRRRRRRRRCTTAIRHQYYRHFHRTFDHRFHLPSQDRAVANRGCLIPRTRCWCCSVRVAAVKVPSVRSPLCRSTHTPRRPVRPRHLNSALLQQQQQQLLLFQRQLPLQRCGALQESRSATSPLNTNASFSGQRMKCSLRCLG